MYDPWIWALAVERWGWRGVLAIVGGSAFAGLVLSVWLVTWIYP